MRIKQRLAQSTTGEPYANQQVRVRRFSDGVTLTTLTSDEDGFVTYQTDGSPGDVYFHVSGVPGGDKFWSSYDRQPAGPVAPDDVPIALSALGDQVIWGLLDELAVSKGSGDTLIVASGGALVAGCPFVNYSPDTLSFTRPSTSTRIDRVVVRVYPGTSTTFPGKQEIALVAGTEGGSAPTLSSGTDVVEVSLAQVSIPVAAPITITDERHGIGQGNPVSVARAETVSTDSSGGEALTGLSITLTLPKARTYQVEATFQAQQVVPDAVTHLLTTGSLGSGTAPNFNGPTQIATDGNGNVYVADLSNNRLMKINSSGAYVAKIDGLTGIFGVAVDSSGNIYIAQSASGFFAFRKYDSALALIEADASQAGSVRHIATDGSHVYTAHSIVIVKRLATTFNVVTSWGSSGTGNGQFNTAYGIAVGGGHVYVSDTVLDRVQKFDTNGNYVTQWGSSGTGNGQFDTPVGIAYDAANNLVLVVDQGNDRIQRFTNTGTFVDAFGSAGSGALQFTNAHGIALDGGNLWVGDFSANRLQKLVWLREEDIGYGQVAVDIDGNLSTYTGIGAISGAVSNGHTRSATGPGTAVVKAYGKALDDTMTLNAAVLTARATAQ